jgi:peptidyl-prolyl cis-trans isomerase C
MISHRSRTLFALCLALTLAAGLGCNKTTPSKAQAAKDAGAATKDAGDKKKKETAKKTKSSTDSNLPFEATGPVAVVNGEKITAEQYNKQAKRLAQIARRLPPQMLVAQKDRIVDGLIDQTLIEDKIEETKVEVPEAEIDKEFQKFKARFPNEAKFKEFLGKQELTVEKIKSDIGKSLKVKQYLAQKANLDLGDEALEKYYEEHKEDYKQEASIKARHILIKVPEGADEAKIAEAKKKAEELAEKAREKNTDFAELARKNSQGPSATNGGLLDYFTPDRMVKPFSEAAFSLEPGKISDPVRTKFGFHVIKVIDKKDAETKSFEEVKDSIKKRLENEGLRNAMKSTIEKLRAEADIKKMPENIKTNLEMGKGSRGGGMQLRQPQFKMNRGGGAKGGGKRIQVKPRKMQPGKGGGSAPANK